jgi:hypothetical protein
MCFYQTSFNLVVGNNITCKTNAVYSRPGGIFFNSASNNSVYHNNFRIDIGGQAGNLGSSNVWDDGYPFGGNYWSDYLTVDPNATEIGNLGIGNIPYVIDWENKDRYPLMKPFTTATYLLQTTPPEVTLQSPLNQMYNESSVSLVFSVDKAANWMGYSLDGEPNVTISGNSTVYNMTNGIHSITIYANDTFGNVGTSETINFTIKKAETQTFQTIIIIAVVGTSTVIVATGLLVYFKKHKPNTESDKKP